MAGTFHIIGGDSNRCTSCACRPVPIARDAMLAEAGLDLAIGANATVRLAYTGQIARNVYDHAAKGRFSWRF